MLGVGGYLTLNECYGEGKGQKKATEGQDPPSRSLLLPTNTHTPPTAEGPPCYIYSRQQSCPRIPAREGTSRIPAAGPLRACVFVSKARFSNWHNAETRSQGAGR